MWNITSLAGCERRASTETVVAEKRVQKWRSSRTSSHVFDAAERCKRSGWWIVLAPPTSRRLSAASYQPEEESGDDGRDGGMC